MSYRIEVLGRPAPKGSMIAAKTKAGKPYTYPASKHERPWVNAVRDTTKNVMRHHEMIEPPYTVDLTIRVPEGSDPRRSPWPVAHDLDKLVRSVLDGLVKGGALADDRHILELHCRKEYAVTPQMAGVVAYVYRATTAQQRAA